MPTTLVSTPGTWPAPPSSGQLPQGPSAAIGRTHPESRHALPRSGPAQLLPSVLLQPCPPRKKTSAGGGVQHLFLCSRLLWAACSAWQCSGDGWGGRLDTGPFVPSLTWLLGMKLSYSKILTQRGKGRFWKVWGWGALDSSSLAGSHLSDVGSSSSGGLVTPAWDTRGLVRVVPLDAFWQSLPPAPLFCQACLWLLPAEGKPSVGGGSLQGPWCPHGGRNRGSGTNALLMVASFLSPQNGAVPSEATKRDQNL